MAIETWFPLAVYFEDLRPPADVRTAMRDYLVPFIEAHAATDSDGFAWTGDTRSCWQLHGMPAFHWLRGEVERHALRFSRELGVNLSVVGFYFQRSWPVLSREGEQVARHSHPNAALSAVYFLDVEGDPNDLEKGGRLVFHNETEQNTLGIGFGTRQTRGLSEWNPLNFQFVTYPAVQDRLVLFPARQSHSVEPNRSGALRVSIAFDIAVTCSNLADPGRHEFLVPPPEHWEEFSSEVDPFVGHPEDTGA